MRQLGQAKVYIAKQNDSVGEVYNIYIGQWKAGNIRRRFDMLRAETVYDYEMGDAFGMVFPSVAAIEKVIADMLEAE